MKVDIKRGDVVIVRLCGAEGVEKAGPHPCVVIQNDVGNGVSPMTIVAPITDIAQYKKLPVQVLLSAHDFGCASGAKEGVVELGHIRAIDRDLRILSKAPAGLSVGEMAAVDRAIRTSLSV